MAKITLHNHINPSNDLHLHQQYIEMKPETLTLTSLKRYTNSCYKQLRREKIENEK